MTISKPFETDLEWHTTYHDSAATMQTFTLNSHFECKQRKIPPSPQPPDQPPLPKAPHAQHRGSAIVSLILFAPTRIP